MRRASLTILCLPLIAALATATAAAQDKPPAAKAADPAGDNTVVVTGHRQTSVKSAQHFIRKTVVTNEGQLARFLDPVCPQVLGVPASLAKRMEDRIRFDADQARVPLDKEGCEPNLVAVIAKSADGVVAYMRKHHNTFFADFSDIDLHDAFTSGMVHSWRETQTRDEDGVPVHGAVESFGSSIFKPPVQEATLNAVVILDKSVVLDKTVNQLSDYIAMRALVGARPPKPDKPSTSQPADAEDFSTILTLFDRGTTTPPKELTSMDLGLLDGLYAIEPTQTAMGQFFNISRQMAHPGSDAGK